MPFRVRTLPLRLPTSPLNNVNNVQSGEMSVLLLGILIRLVLFFSDDLVDLKYIICQVTQPNFFGPNIYIV